MSENCRDYAESADDCASVEQTNAFWDTTDISVIPLLHLKQVVMKDIAEPIRQVLTWISARMSKNTSELIDWQVGELAPNEFTSNEDYIGMFESEPEP